MISIKPLFSGSSGNCTLINADGRAFLIDAGVSAKRICDALQREGLSPFDIEALFVTHDHIDHVGGISVLSKKYRIPTFMNEGTAKACVENAYFAPSDFSDNLFLFEGTVGYSAGGISVSSFPVPHDAAAAVGFRIEACGETVCIATDTGHVTEEMLDSFKGCRTAVIEANHDLSMLESGPYPRWLKDRVASPFGHLSNDDCAAFAGFLVENGTKSIILAHISRENNTPELALSAVGRRTGGEISLQAAQRSA